MQAYTIDKLLDMEPMDFMKWAIKEFHLEIPTNIEDIDDASLVGELLAKSSNQYSYLCELQGMFKILARDAGRKGDKKLKEDIIDKNTLIDEVGKGLKQQYQTLSRMITVRYMNLEESKMSDSRSFNNNDIPKNKSSNYVQQNIKSFENEEMNIDNNLQPISNYNSPIINQSQNINQINENNTIPTSSNEPFKSIYDEVPF